jgi:hypothetical protein
LSLSARPIAHGFVNSFSSGRLATRTSVTSISIGFFAAAMDRPLEGHLQPIDRFVPAWQPGLGKLAAATHHALAPACQLHQQARVLAKEQSGSSSHNLFHG